MDDLDTFWIESLWAQVNWARRAGYRTSQWRIHPQAMTILRRLNYGGVPYWAPPLSPSEPELLFGYPIVVDSRMHGAVLEPVDR